VVQSAEFLELHGGVITSLGLVFDLKLFTELGIH
jgi:hypothetical protein